MIVQESNQLHNNFQMRMYLTENATKLMQLNRRKACDANCCSPCQAPYQSGTMMPEASAEVVGTPVPCGTKRSQPALVGAHSDSPLTCAAWNTGDSREVQYNCCSPVQNLANTYPHSADGVVVSRKSVQGGGMPAVNSGATPDVVESFYGGGLMQLVQPSSNLSEEQKEQQTELLKCYSKCNKKYSN